MDFLISIVIIYNMTFTKFLKYLYTKLTFDDSNYDLLEVDIRDESIAKNIYEVFISRIFQYLGDHPEKYNSITYQKGYYELILKNSRLKYYTSYMDPKPFNYKWQLEIERLDTQALFPEYVDGPLVCKFYDYEVRPGYAIRIEYIFTSAEDKILDNLL